MDNLFERLMRFERQHKRKISEEKVEGRCLFGDPMKDSQPCLKKTETHKYICDKHAEEVEDSPHGRYCDDCGVDTFNEDHDPGCSNYGMFFVCEVCGKVFEEINPELAEEWDDGMGAPVCDKCRKKSENSPQGN